MCLLLQESLNRHDTRIRGFLNAKFFCAATRLLFNLQTGSPALFTKTHHHFQEYAFLKMDKPN